MGSLLQFPTRATTAFYFKNPCPDCGAKRTAKPVWNKQLGVVAFRVLPHVTCKSGERHISLIHVGSVNGDQLLSED